MANREKGIRPSVSEFRSSYLDKSVSVFITPQTRDRDMYTVNSSDSISLVLDKISLRSNYEDAVVVLERKSAVRVIGLVSDTDLFSWFKEKPPHRSDGPVNDIMNEDYFFVYEKSRLRNAIAKMREKDVRHILVLNEQNDYVGWVNLQGIVNKFKEDLNHLYQTVIK